MNCDQFKEKVLDFLYEEIPEEERAEAVLHLKACSSCNAEVNEFKLVRSDLAEWKDPAARDFSITVPYPSPLGFLKQWLIPEQWGLRNVAALATASAFLLLVAFSVLGTEIEISKNGFAFRADLLRRPDSAPSTPAEPRLSPASPAVLPSPSSINAQEPARSDILREVSRLIQESENRQEQLVKSEEIRLVNQLTSGYRTQLADLARRLNDKHKLDYVAVYDNLEQQRLADLQQIRMAFTSLDARTSQQAKQTQQLVDLIQKASYQPK
ncbi:MAG: zf-HC2 domain-containing protein [Acidobacteriia bacterium]|nr:zf-HC2 domain-containing protein [Terriglobia bacterium]